MTAKWGVFLCNCRRTLPLDPQKLVLPSFASVLQFASELDTDLREFALAVNRDRPDRILISCCLDQKVFDEALTLSGPQAPQGYSINLKESCFLPHPDPDRAHAKAARLLRAAMEVAEAKETPVYNPLNVGGRILVAADSLKGKQLADELRDIAQPILVVPPDGAVIDGDGRLQLYPVAHSPRLSSGQAPETTTWHGVYRGRIIEIKGHLGGFRATIEVVSEAEAAHHEVKADQIVIVSQNGPSLFKPRTGCHLLINPSEADLHATAARVRELTGAFLKPVHVRYETDICAGGTANQQACGICITACPYDAISRDPETHLRVRVEHGTCEGCGACVSACPTSALHFTEPSPHELYTRMAALLTPVPGQNGAEPLTILFHCGEQGRRALEEAGRRPLPYPASVLPVEVPCLRYVSEANILAAFRLGAAGVGLLGCERCPHGERELLHRKLDFSRLTLVAFGLGPERLRLVTADQSTEAEAITALSSFAASLDVTPIRWDGKPLQYWDNREVVAEAIRTFIEQLGREPGRRTFDAPHPFAFADVKDSGCTMCRSCVNACPTHAFKLDEKTQSLQFKHIACVACGLCENVCPEKVITLKREIFFERDALEYQTVVQDDMACCAKCGKPYINRRALETVEARVLSLESLLDTFSGSRRNLLRMCPDCRAVAAMLEVDKGWKP